MKITHYDLFAGIGGFSLALDTVFYDSEIKHIFCEWEAFPTAVLKKHWPDGTYYGDIADLVADTASERQQGQGEYQRPVNSKENTSKETDTATGNNTEGLTILTGGFPCQPFSHAGRRQGTADDRYKWPDMFSVIQNVRPDWVIAENVRGLVTWNEGMVLETVCADLESEGYEVQPIVIPAVAIGAPHRRDRVWIVAYSKDNDGRGELRNILGEDAEKSKSQEQHEDKSGELSDAGINAPNPYSQRVGDGSSEVQATNGEIPERNDNAEPIYSNEQWSRDWREVAFASCDGSLDDGLPRDMAGLTISYAKYRREALKSVGNSIVPQVAMEIFEAIREAQNIIKLSK